MSDHYGKILIDSGRNPIPVKPTVKSGKKPTGKKVAPGKRVYIIVFSFLATLALYAGLGFFLVPVFVTSYLPDLLFKDSGLEASLQGAAFNPFTCLLSMERVKIDQVVDGRSTLLQLGKVDLELNIPSLLRNGFACNYLEIDSLVLSLTRFKDASYNISSLFKDDKKLNPKNMIEFAELPFLFSLNNISITNSHIIFDDKISEKTHKVEEIDLRLPTLSNFQYSTDIVIEPSLKAIINGSPIVLSSTPLSSRHPNDQSTPTSLTCKLTELDLPLYAHYIPTPLPFRMTKGRADILLHFEFQTLQDNKKNLLIGFQATLKNTGMESRDQSLSLMTPEAILKGSLQPFTEDITFKNIILRNPELSVRDNFSSHTLESLIFNNVHPQHQISPNTLSPSLVLELLLADDGSVHLLDSNGKTKQSFHSLQANIKNFSNKAGRTREIVKENGTFRLSGELDNGKGSFAWQGEVVENNTFQGSFQLSNLPVSSFFISGDSNLANQTSGSVDLQGIMTVWADHQGNSPFHYSLNNGNLSISELKFLENSKEWLHVKNVKITPVTFTETKSEAGNIYLENSTLTLRNSNLPAQIHYMIKKENISLQAIDFSGTVNILPRPSFEALSLSNVHFQLTHLPNKNMMDENFAFTANTEDNGQIKATGKIMVSPFKAELELGFVNVPSKQLLPFYTVIPPDKKYKGKLSGRGLFNLPEKEYSGFLKMSDGFFQDTKSKRQYKWDLASFDDVTIKHVPFIINGTSFDIDNLQVQQKETPFLSMEKASCTSFTFEAMDKHISCESAKLEAPFFQIHQYRGTPHNFLRLQQLLSEYIQIPKTNNSTHPIPIASLHFPELVIERGTVFFHDHRLQPSWKIKMLQFQGTIDHLSTKQPLQETTYNFSGILGSNPISLNGTAQIFDIPLKSRTVIKTSAFPLASFGKQLPNLLDINRNGKFNLILESRWRDRKEEGMAHFNFSSIFPSSNTADTSMILALLNNKNYTFSLDVPLINSEQKPQRSLFLTTVNQFTKLMVKASVDPLLVTDTSFKDLVGLHHIEFTEGRSHPTNGGKHTLLRYRELLKAYPHLQLVMTGMVDPEHDHKILLQKLEEREKRRIDEINLRRKEEWQQRQTVKQKVHPTGTFVEQDIPPEELSIYTPLTPQQVQVNDRDLLVLARKRAAKAKEIISAGLPPERIRLNNEAIITKGQRVPGNRVTLELGFLPFPSLDISDSQIAGPGSVLRE